MSRLCGRLKITPLLYSWEIGAVFFSDGTADWPEAASKRARALNFLFGGGGRLELLSENQSRLSVS